MDLAFISTSGTTLEPGKEYTGLINKIILFFKYPIATGAFSMIVWSIAGASKTGKVGEAHKIIRLSNDKYCRR